MIDSRKTKESYECSNMSTYISSKMLKIRMRFEYLMFVNETVDECDVNLFVWVGGSW